MTPTQPISVTLLTKKSEKYLEQCLESLRDFNGIIILDYGSEDRILTIAEHLPSIRIQAVEGELLYFPFNDANGLLEKMQHYSNLMPHTNPQNTTPAKAFSQVLFADTHLHRNIARKNFVDVSKYSIERNTLKIRRIYQELERS